MPVFEYKARNRRGESMSGTMDAETAERVAEQLFNSGITPVNIQQLEQQQTAAREAGNPLSMLLTPASAWKCCAISSAHI